MESPVRRPVFYLCGDSLTQQGGEVLPNRGWCLQLQHQYERSVDVVNRGLSGYDTQIFLSHAMPVIREELRSVYSPAVITLWLGANDAALAEGPARRQHVPLHEYKQNLVTILQEFRQLAPEAKILLITPPTVDDDKRREILERDAGPYFDGVLDRTNEQAGLYAAACAEAASEVEGVTLLDMYALLMQMYPDRAGRAHLLRDGLHFSKEGNRVVFHPIKARIKTLLPEEMLKTWQVPNSFHVHLWKAMESNDN